METLAGLEAGLAVPSRVVLSERHRCRGFPSLDERRFRVQPGLHGKPFRLLPADV